ncbi:MAG: hypothetical protein WBB65_14525 [Anaerolineales bacterium]
MIWFPLILALIGGVVVALYTRSYKRALGVGLILLAAGIVISFIIVYSGILGG